MVRDVAHLTSQELGLFAAIGILIRFAGFRIAATDTPWAVGEGQKVEGPMEAILLLLTGPLLALPRLSGEGALLSTHDWQPHVSVTSVGAPSGGPPTFAPSCALAAWPRCHVDASRSGETRAVAARSDWSARQPRTGPGLQCTSIRG
jgi:hypothetical protein